MRFLVLSAGQGNVPVSVGIGPFGSKASSLKRQGHFCGAAGLFWANSGNPSSAFLSKLFILSLVGQGPAVFTWSQSEECFPFFQDPQNQSLPYTGRLCLKWIKTKKEHFLIFYSVNMLLNFIELKVWRETHVVYFSASRKAVIQLSHTPENPP